MTRTRILAGIAALLTLVALMPSAWAQPVVNYLTIWLGTSGSAAGSLLFYNASNANTATVTSGVTTTTYTLKLPPTRGTIGQALTTDGGAPAQLDWTTITASHAMLSTSVTDSTPSAVARGSLITGQGATPTWTQLVISVANRVLRSDGTDVAWAQVALATDVSGTLPVGSGGTGIASGTSGGVPYFSAAATIASSAALASGGVVLGGGAGAAPSTDADFSYLADVLLLGAAGAGTNATEWQKTMGGGAVDDNFLRVAGTTPATLTATTNGIFFDITGAGSSAQELHGTMIRLGAGYTGTSKSAALLVSNRGAAASTYGLVSWKYDNAGSGSALVGMAQDGTNQVAVHGILDGGVGLETLPTAPNVTSAGLFNNGTSVNNILTGQDNAVTVFTLADGMRSATFDSNGLGLGGAAAAGVELEIITAGDTDVIARSSSTTGLAYFSARNNNGGNAAGYFATYGSAYAGPNIFGIARASITALSTDGTSSTGLVVGTVTADPLILGTNDISREFFAPTKSLTNNTVTSVASCTLASNTVGAFKVAYSVEVFDATDVQVEVGEVTFKVTNKGGVIANNTAVKYGNQQSMTAGTLTVTWTITAASPALIQINANSSLTPSAGYPRVTFRLDNLTQQAVALE